MGVAMGGVLDSQISRCASPAATGCSLFPDGWELPDPFGLRESSSNAARCAPINESAPRYIPESQVKDDIWIDRQKQPEIDADAFV